MIAAFQETKLTKETKFDVPDFTTVRKDRDKNKGGGLLFLVHKTINFSPVELTTDDPHLEAQAIQVNNLRIVNVYLPPASSCSTTGYNPSIAHLLTNQDSLIMGDFNAHDPLWSSSMQDARGSNFSNDISNSTYGVLNTDNHTRLPDNNQQPSSPDISLASAAILPYATWQVHKTFGSDHLPISINLTSDIKPQPSENRTYINFRKADWTQFEQDTEREFESLPLPTDVYKSEQTFRRIVNGAAKKNIPAGRIKSIIPEIPTATANLIKERDRLRESQPDAPEISALNKQIEIDINKHKRDKWREAISEHNVREDSSKFFKLIKHLNGNNRTKENSSIKFKGKYISKAKLIANNFNKQYATVVRHVSNKESRHITNSIKAQKTDDPKTFSPMQTKAAIKKAKASKAMGPDKIATIHLKHLGPKGLDYLTGIFNLSVKHSQIPAIWKQSKIVPLLKPGKDPADSNSYRPVSLLCPAIKVLERLILPSLTEHLQVPEIQHGFRSDHSTVTALHDFNQVIAEGFNQKKPAHRTVLLQLDLSKAFDMVNHDKLLKDLNNSTLPPDIKRWFGCYLHGRQSRVLFRNELSSSHNVRAGVPQGAVTSPVLFNFYLANLPPPPQGVRIVQYADDMSVFASGVNIQRLTDLINDYVPSLLNFLRERELKFSAEKSTVTLFTPSTAEANTHPQIFVEGQPVKLDKEPKLLGVIFDTMYTFSKHAKKTVAKAKSKINIIKQLAGSKWGQDKDTMLLTYKAIGRSTLEYATPIWGPAISDTHWSNLQTVQNQALRAATGCLMMTNQDHLHQECKVMPLREHSELLTKQFLARCHLPDHPGNKHLDQPNPPRTMKATLLTHEQDVKAQFNQPPSITEYKKVIKNLHTSAVQKVIATQADNKVLNRRPPPIKSTEKSLSRRARSYLAQLRSGYSRKLKSYLHRIDEQIEDKCPSCFTTPHTTHHLFNCNENPTDLDVESLWTKPCEAAEFLHLDSDSDEDDMA